VNTLGHHTCQTIIYMEPIMNQRERSIDLMKPSIFLLLLFIHVKMSKQLQNLQQSFEIKPQLVYFLELLTLID